MTTRICLMVPHSNDLNVRNTYSNSNCEQLDEVMKVLKELNEQKQQLLQTLCEQQAAVEQTTIYQSSLVSPIEANALWQQTNGFIQTLRNQVNNEVFEIDQQIESLKRQLDAIMISNNAINAANSVSNSSILTIPSVPNTSSMPNMNSMPMSEVSYDLGASVSASNDSCDGSDRNYFANDPNDAISDSSDVAVSNTQSKTNFGNLSNIMSNVSDNNFERNSDSNSNSNSKISDGGGCGNKSNKNNINNNNEHRVSSERTIDDSLSDNLNSPKMENNDCKPHIWDDIDQIEEFKFDSIAKPTLNNNNHLNKKTKKSVKSAKCLSQNTNMNSLNVFASEYNGNGEYNGTPSNNINDNNNNNKSNSNFMYRMDELCCIENLGATYDCLISLILTNIGLNTKEKNQTISKRFAQLSEKIDFVNQLIQTKMKSNGKETQLDTIPEE